MGKLLPYQARYYAMDRDNRWDRIEKAYRAIALGEGVIVNSAEQAMEQSYAEGKTDEFVLPSVICENQKPVTKVSDGDGMIFFNFRPDRAREITRTFIEQDFEPFARKYISVFFWVL